MQTELQVAHQISYTQIPWEFPPWAVPSNASDTGYDSRGNRKALIDQDGGRFTYSYDAVNRITQVINPQWDRTTYGYDPAGRRSVKKLANGTRASFTYHAAGS